MGKQRLAFSLELRLELPRAITITARPGFGSVLVAAIPAGVSVLHLEQLEVFLPVGTFFRQRCCAKTDLDPTRGAVSRQACLLHVMLVLVTRDRATAERAAPHRLEQGVLPAGFNPGSDQITHSGTKRLWLRPQMRPRHSM